MRDLKEQISKRESLSFKNPSGLNSEFTLAFFAKSLEDSLLDK